MMSSNVLFNVAAIFPYPKSAYCAGTSALSNILASRDLGP